MLLGLPSFVVVVLLIFGLFIRSMCRSATDKEEEITKLVAVAAKEAKLAELDASVGYGSVASVPLKKGHCCAVCYSPTTTRCSRCKAVRYWLVCALSLFQFQLLRILVSFNSVICLSFSEYLKGNSIDRKHTNTVSTMNELSMK